MRVESYTIAVPEAVLDDLRDAYPPHPLARPGAGRAVEPGHRSGLPEGLLAYWADGFDWRAQERELNRYASSSPRSTACAIHFVHHRAPGGGLPLVLTHGWPSTFVELLPLVDRLGDRFDLVVPSLPGYAFSPRPPHVGVDRAYVAATLARADAGARVRALRRARRRLRRRGRHLHGAAASPSG